MGGEEEDDEEDVDEEDQVDDDVDQDDDVEEDDSSSESVIEELKPGELVDRPITIPKRLSLLEDKLTGYFSPKGGKRSRRSPERLSLTAAVSTGSRKLSAEARRSSSSRRVRRSDEMSPVQARKRPAPRSLMQEDLPRREVETSTPVEGRSVRSRPRVSYAEVPDTNAFDLSTGDEESPFERGKKYQPAEVSKTRFEVDLRERLDECDASGVSRSPRRFVLGSSLRKRRDVESNSSSSGASSRVKVSEGKQDLSQEIVDLSHADTTQEDVESEDDFESPPRPSGHPLPPKSPGKYQSSVTPGRGIKLVINRIKKPSQLELEMSPPKPLIMPRLSRGVCKEMGISPNKLQSIIAQSPPPKPKPLQSTTPEKENRPRTPKLLLKRMPSSSLANSPLASKWKAETKHSPVKAPVNAGLQSPGKLAYSPLSARSIHKLSTSPIINSHGGEGRRPKKKVNKQLAYNA